MVSTRLAIVDIEGGEQPLSGEDGRFWVVQNGEVYNHVELRAELEARGHAFATSCDTEVLVHGYEEWGPRCLHRLNGDFAFAVWDRREQELFLARDRFGVRPLYLAQFGAAFSFASEAKALLRHSQATRELDPSGLVEFFTTWSISPARSAFKGIRELAPAHYLRFGPEGLIEERRWWDLSFARTDASEADQSELAEELRDLLADATRLRLRADVPVGAYLSGGLDSSLIAALAQPMSSEPLAAFGVGFQDRRFDESSDQRHVADELGVDLTRVTVSAGEIGELFPQAVEVAGQPTLRTAPVPLLQLSGAVQDAGLKVVLTGEGADELFAGYEIFREAKVRGFCARDAQSTLRPLLLRRLHRELPADLRSSPFLEQFFGRGLAETSDPLYSHRIRFANSARTLHVFDREVLRQGSPDFEPLEALRERLPPAFASFTALGKAQYLELVTFLESYLLHAQGDRMLMAHSIEGRFPFLDFRVAEFAARVPDSLRLRGLREKHLLRQAAAPLLPTAVTARPKQPYRAPLAPVFVGPARPAYVTELLGRTRLRETGLFSPDVIERVVRKCERLGDRAAGETEQMALTGVISVMLLHEQLVARPSLAAPATPGKVVIGASVGSPLAAVHA